MNGPATSVVGSIALGLAGVIAGWLAAHNIIPAADVTADTALIGTGIAGAVGFALILFKAKTATLGSHAAAINTPGTGLKTVDVNAAAPMVTTPPTSDQVKIAAVNAIEGVKVVRDSVPAPVVLSPPKP